MESKDNKSHNPKVIYEVASQQGRLKALERRSLPRLSLTSEQFRLSKLNRIFSVTDISEKGMGLGILDKADYSLFRVGMVIEGTLNLRREKYELTANVRNLSRERIGCEFEKLSEPIQKALANLLDPKVLGAELKPIPSSQAGTMMDTIWYHGPSGTDLVLRRLKDGRFERLTLYVFGQFIQWDQDQGISTGQTLSSPQQRSEIRGIVRLETLFLEQDETPDTHKLEIAKTIILSSNLPKDLKSWCIRQLER